jgi:hypothetical protein
MKPDPFLAVARAAKLPPGTTSAEVRDAIREARGLVGLLVGTQNLEGRITTRGTAQKLKRQATLQLLERKRVTGCNTPSDPRGS